MGFEPTTLHDLVECSSHQATGEQGLGFFSESTFLHTFNIVVVVVVVVSLTHSLWMLVGCIWICYNVTTRCCYWVYHVLVITWLCSCAMRFQSRPTNWPLLTTESPVAQWLEHPTRSQRFVGSNPIWDSRVFRVYISPYIYIHVVWLNRYKNKKILNWINMN